MQAGWVCEVAPGLGAYRFCGCWIQGTVRAQVLGAWKAPDSEAHGVLGPVVSVGTKFQGSAGCLLGGSAWRWWLVQI